MKKFLFILLIAGLILSLSSTALAYVNESWDWHLVKGKAKRTLHYCASTATEYTNKDRVLEIEKAKGGLPENWTKWLKEAVDNWNKADLGWQLVSTEFNIPPCQVVIVLADFDEATTGGGMASINDADKDGKMDLTIIAMDEKLEQTLKNLPDDQDNIDGQRDGWSTSDQEQTRDPVGVLKHELSHAMRLDHHPDAKHDVVSDSDLTDPRQPGDHNKELSDEDKREAAMSYRADAIFPNFRPCFRKNYFNYQGVEIAFEANSFKDMNNMPLRKFSGVAIPSPITLSDGYSHIIDNTAIWFKTDLPILKPLSISIPYTDVDLNGGNSKWIGDYHGLVPPALDESTIAAFKYIEEPFGIQAEGYSHWEKVDNATVDTEKNKVTFQTMEAGTYGLSAKPKAGEASIDQQMAEAAAEVAKTGTGENTKSDQQVKYLIGGLGLMVVLGGLIYLLKPSLFKKK